MTGETATRKRAGKQLRMEGDGWPKPNPEVEAAAQEVADKLRLKNKAAEKYNTAVDQCKETMTRHGVDSVRIDEGGKMLTLTRDLKLKIVKVKETASGGSDEDE